MGRAERNLNDLPFDRDLLGGVVSSGLKEWWASAGMLDSSRIAAAAGRANNVTLTVTPFKLVLDYYIDYFGFVP